MVTINGREYEFGDLQLLLGGVEITGFRGITITTTVDKEPVYGKGRHPRSIQHGNYAHSGQIVLLQSELEKLRSSSRTGSVLDLTLDAVLNYGGNIENGAGTYSTRRVIGLEFTEETEEMNQEDKFMEVTLSYVALRTIYN